MPADTSGIVTRSVVDRLVLRHRVLQLTRAHFDKQAFVEVETPSVVPSPGLDVHLDAFGVSGGSAAPGLSTTSAPRFLATSPEYQMKRLLASGMPNIYQVCRAFRRDEEGHNHQPEFTMLEWYRANAGSHELMRDTEQLVASVAQQINGTTFLERDGQRLDLAPPWPRMTVAAAFERYAGCALDDVVSDEDRFFRLLVERIEPELGRAQPMFLTHYPASMASLARIDPHDRRYADRFEAYVFGIELCNGFGELTDAVEQRARLLSDQATRKTLGKDIYPLDGRFLAALEHGLPDSGGNALGFDRLVMLLLGTARVEDVMAFPASRL